MPRLQWARVLYAAALCATMFAPMLTATHAAGGRTIDRGAAPYDSSWAEAFCYGDGLTGSTPNCQISAVADEEAGTVTVAGNLKAPLSDTEAADTFAGLEQGLILPMSATEVAFAADVEVRGSAEASGNDGYAHALVVLSWSVGHGTCEECAAWNHTSWEHSLDCECEPASIQIRRTISGTIRGDMSPGQILFNFNVLGSALVASGPPPRTTVSAGPFNMGVRTGLEEDQNPGPFAAYHLELILHWVEIRVDGRENANQPPHGLEARRNQTIVLGPPFPEWYGYYNCADCASDVVQVDNETGNVRLQAKTTRAPYHSTAMGDVRNWVDVPFAAESATFRIRITVHHEEAFQDRRGSGSWATAELSAYGQAPTVNQWNSITVAHAGPCPGCDEADATSVGPVTFDLAWRLAREDGRPIPPGPYFFMAGGDVFAMGEYVSLLTLDNAGANLDLVVDSATLEIDPS